MKPLVAVTRQGKIESIHWGIVCVTNKNGEVIYNIGDPSTKIYFRSSAKPIQVLPFIQSGASEALGFTTAEIALACSSHTGEAIHQEIVAQALNRIGLKISDLHCGIMRPYDEDEDKRLIALGKEPSLFHCSCSGKHVAMLALATHMGYQISDYESITNPLQQEIIKAVENMAEERISKDEIAKDGCGAPIFLLPIKKIALAYAKLVAKANIQSGDLPQACKLVVEAITHYPELVSGQREFCAELIRATKGRLVAKIGAESVYCIGVRDKEVGICVKISDGSERALFPAVLHVLKILNYITDEELKSLNRWYNTPVFNNLNELVGEIIPVFETTEYNCKLGMPINIFNRADQ